MTPNEESGAPTDVEDAGREELRKLEEADEVPKDPKDWPDGPAKFLTYDNESDAPYGEGNTAKLGPAGVVHHEDGSVTVDGEPVDDPSQFKGEPIESAVSDPDRERIEGAD